MYRVHPRRTSSFRVSEPSAEWDILPVDGTNAKQINLVTSPDSGAAQSAYDLWPGADDIDTTADPLFTSGSPDYMAYDGADYNSLVSGANTNLIRDVHKTTGGTAVTFGIAFKTPSAFAAGAMFYSTFKASGTDAGFKFQLTALGIPFFNQAGGGSQALWTLGSALNTSTDYLILLAVDFTNSATDVTYWVNTTTGVVDTDDTAAATTTNATFDMRFGARAGTPIIQFLENGTRQYRWQGWNGVIDDAQAAIIFAENEATLGIDFLA